MSGGIQNPNRIAGWLRGVLYTVSCNDLSERATISKAVGRQVRAELIELVKLGYIRTTASKRQDGTSTTLYTVTTKGVDALDAPLHELSPAPSPSPAPAEQPVHTSAQVVPTVAGHRCPYSTAYYAGAELEPYSTRKGAIDAFALPSRFGNELRYPDGRVVQVDSHNRSA